MAHKDKSAVKIVLLSDTHQLHRRVDIPSGDIFIHAGDFTMFSRSLSAVRDFDAWLGELPHRDKVVIFGNHECLPSTHPWTKQLLLNNATVLHSEGTEIHGLRIWGCPALFDKETRRREYARIPEDTDILITHIGPYGVLDYAPDSGVHGGCRELFDAVMRVRPKLHVFGHVHGAQGIFQTNDTTFVNAALLGMHGDLDQSPIVLQMRKI